MFLDLNRFLHLLSCRLPDWKQYIRRLSPGIDSFEIFLFVGVHRRQRPHLYWGRLLRGLDEQKPQSARRACGPIPA